ncbi:MAG: C4-type zinc ribbon domain-containing protein [Synoicihabitans sp.]
MKHPAIEPLLILQDREQTRRSLTQNLAAVPVERGRVQGKIDAEKDAIEAAKTEWKELESQKKLLETEIGSAEGKLAKYRTQQSLVKKNDEYQALGHEIESTEAEISKLEERELEIMYEIDAAKERFAAAEKELQDNIADYQDRLAVLAEREASLKSELASAEAAVESARGGLDMKPLRLFDQIAPRTFPVCVSANGGKCDGCHLRVSGEVEAVARKGEDLARCDQCGRILWWESS